MKNTFFFEYRTVYEIMWKNIVERGSTQMTMWRMCITCWISKATDTHRLCNTHCFPTTTKAARTHLSVTLYVHCLSCYLYGR